MTAAMTASVERTSVVEPHLRILHTVAEAVSKSLDVDEVLTTALDALTHVTGHEMSSLHLLSEDGHHLHLKAERRLSERLRDVNVLLPVGKGHLGDVATNGMPLVSENPRRLEDLRKTQAQLVHAEKLSAAGQLAPGVAHEINNPLTTILGQTHLLLTQQPLTDHVRERLNIIGDETARAARIVQNLLLFSRYYPAERHPCLLEDQVRRVLDLKAYQLQQDAV